MSTELDNLKSTWQSLNDSHGHRRTALPDEACDAPRGDLRPRGAARPHRIVGIYRRLTVICALWVPLSLLFIRSGLFPQWMPYAMAGYFVVMGALAYSVLDAVRRIDFCRMSVVEAMKAVCHIQRLRLWHKGIGILMCVPMLTVMFMSFAHINNEVLLGGVLGLVAGAAIGLTLDMKVRREIRQIKQTLEEAADGD